MSNKPSTRRRVRRSPEQWQALLDQYESSGLSQQLFCRQSGLPYSTFTRWRSRLLCNRSVVDTAGDSPELFVELTNQAVESPSAFSGWDVELQLGEQVFLRLRRPPC
jgi:hypothetical protein